MRILLAGETFTIASHASAGFTAFSSGQYNNGAEHFLAAAASAGHVIEQVPSERCERDFPRSAEALAAYAAVILSDISALTLLFTPESRLGQVSQNRLVLLRDYVEEGGGLMMAGGYTSFQGMDGAARFHGTPLEECLPVSCLPYADGLEAPEGLTGLVRLTAHPLARDLPARLPPILGLNRTRFEPRPDSDLVMEVEYRGRSYPLMAARRFGKGRSLAFTTDVGPHWMSRPFLESPCYPQLVANILGWLTGR
jgi:uncharacterized membrane protein